MRHSCFVLQCEALYGLAELGGAHIVRWGVDEIARLRQRLARETYVFRGPYRTARPATAARLRACDIA
jgi:hypothetical protein